MRSTTYCLYCCCLLLGGCGLAETAATGAAGAASEAQQAREAQKLENKVQDDVDAAQKKAAEVRDAAEKESQ